MELTLKKETVTRWEEKVQKQTEVMTESDVIVPDAKPDMGRILRITGIARVGDCQRQGERLLISGTADYCILYAPESLEGNEIESLEIQLPFKDILTGFSEEKGAVDAVAELLEAEAVLLNSRKFSVKGTIGLQVMGREKKEYAFARGVETEKEPAQKTKTISVAGASGFGSATASAGQRLEVPGENPPIASILQTSASIMEEDVKVITGKLICKGNVRLEILYNGPDGMPALMEHALPFTEILDLPAAEEGMTYFTEYTVLDLYCEADEDDGSGRSFGAEVLMEIRGEVWKEEELEILEDFYIPGEKTETETEELMIEDMLVCEKEALAVRKTLSKGDDAPPIAKCIQIAAVPTVTKVALSGGEAEIEGYADVQLLYLADGGSPYLLKERVPFAVSIPTKAPDTAKISCRVGLANASYAMENAEQVEVRLNLDICLRLCGQSRIKNIKDAKVLETDTGRASVVIAFANGKESLWDLGKKYGTAAETIRAYNGADLAAVPAEGTRLLIP